MCCSGAAATSHQFHHLSLAELSDLVKHKNLLLPPHDAVLSNIIKDAFDIIGPSIQLIINSC